MAGIESIIGKANPYIAAGQAVLGVAGGVMQLIQSGKQNKEAKERAQKLITPIATIQQGYRDNQSLAESMAGQGLSDQALAVYERTAANKLGSSVNAILRGGGDVQTISDLYDNAAGNDLNLAMLEEEVRQKNLQSYMRQNEVMAGEQEKVWMINEYAPYQDEKQLIAKLRQQANDNKWKGINSIGGAFNNAMSGSMFGQSEDQPGAATTSTRRTSFVQPTNFSGAGGITPIESGAINNPTIQTNQYLNYLLKRVNLAQ